jgi:hypothetical protein
MDFKCALKWWVRGRDKNKTVKPSHMIASIEDSSYVLQEASLARVVKSGEIAISHVRSSAPSPESDAC